MGIQQQREFLSQITPFDHLETTIFNELADSMNVLYFEAESKVMDQTSDKPSLYILIKGKVAEIGIGGVISHYSVRGFFGDAHILAESDKTTHFETLEECIIYQLSGKQFLKAFKTCDKFSRFFNATIVEKLNRVHQSLQAATSTEVMMDTVCSAPIQKMVLVEEGENLLAATQKMTKVKSDACLVNFKEGGAGIVTSTDVLKFVANGDLSKLTDPSTLSTMANRPIQSVHEYDYLFNALLKMTRFQIDRLVVRNDESYVGFLHQKDLMSLFANQSGLVLLKVEQADSLDALIKVGPQIDELIHNLNRKGIKTHYIAKLVNELHRKMILKLVQLTLPDPLKGKVCIFVMGSEGRSEQVIRTDQDNALIYEDTLSLQERALLESFTEQFINAMKQMGFPLCPGNIMLNNPLWRKSISEFKAQILEWFKKPSDENFMHSAILLDAETVYGSNEWLKTLKDHVHNLNQSYPVFLRHFAVGALRFNTPIGFFGGLVTDTNEKESGAIDIKKGGIFPIVHGIRCYALEAGIEKTNTHWRIKALMDLGVFKKEYGIELGETLNYLNTLRLESMIRQIENGKQIPNNKIVVTDLSHMQQDILKQSLQVVDGFKKRVTQHFNLHGML